MFEFGKVHLIKYVYCYIYILCVQFCCMNVSCMVVNDISKASTREKDECIKI